MESGPTKPVLAPLWDDISPSANSDVRYITTGSPGSQVFTFEWANEKWQYDASSACFSFELKLYEGTNIIEFCYQDLGGTPSSGASASIGITASNSAGGGFMSLQNTSTSPTVSTTVETNNLHNKPANNQVYRFTPLSCPQPFNLHYESYNTSVSFSWGIPSGVSNFEYAVTASADDPVSGTSTSSANATISSLLPVTKYFIHSRSLCSASSQSIWVTVPFSTVNNSSPAPVVAWKKTLGGSSYEGGGGASSEIRQTKDGGYILAGFSGSNDGDVSGNHGSQDGWLCKLDANGTIQWQKSLGGSHFDQIFSVDPTSDGGYILAGYTESNDGDVGGNHGNGDCWVVKTDGNGEIQWQKCLGGSSIEYGLSIRQTSDGGYIMGAVSVSNDGDVSGNHGGIDYWIVKLNSTGSIEWQNSFGGSDDDYLNNVEQTTDGGYVAGGYTPSNDGNVSGNHGSNDIWVLKLSSSGAIQWQKCLGGTGYEGGTLGTELIKQTSEGGYIVATGSGSKDGDVSDNYGCSDAWLCKLSNTGSIQWQKNYGGSGCEEAGDIKETSDGGFIVGGSSSSNAGDVIGNHDLCNYDYWIIKVDNSGAMQWQKCLGGSNSEYVNCIEQTADKGYIIAGYTSSYDGDISGLHGNGGFGDYWIVKLGPDALLPDTELTLTGEARGKQNFLHWSTVTEQNNKGFEVQRSTDGYNFSKIGFVNSKATNGNSNLKLNYDFTDMGFASSINYYRLKQIDQDGKFSYSNIVVLRDENAITAGLSTIYPNPVKNTLNVKVASLNNNEITMLITDISGKMMRNKTTQLGSGESIVQVDVSSLPSGTYFLKIVWSNGYENTVKKFIKE